MVTSRRHLIDLLSHEPRTASSVARELRLQRGDIEGELRHALRSADRDRITKPGRCPSCKGSRLFEPLLRLADDEPE